MGRLKPNCKGGNWLDGLGDIMLRHLKPNCKDDLQS
jgi:hypothetical protein